MFVCHKQHEQFTSLVLGKVSNNPLIDCYEITYPYQAQYIQNLILDFA